MASYSLTIGSGDFLLTCLDAMSTAASTKDGPLEITEADIVDAEKRKSIRILYAIAKVTVETAEQEWENDRKARAEA